MNFQTPEQRRIAKRNLLTTALGVAFERQLINGEPTSFEFEIAGLPALGCVSADREEISIHAIVSPTKLAERFACSVITHRRPLFGAAVASGWLDRATGKFISVAGGFRASNEVTPVLAGLRMTKAATRRSAEISHFIGVLR